MKKKKYKTKKGIDTSLGMMREKKSRKSKLVLLWVMCLAAVVYFVMEDRDLL